MFYNTNSVSGTTSPQQSHESNKKKKELPKKLQKQQDRNTGKEYVNSAGKTVPARTWCRLPDGCKRKCSTKITCEDQKRIFNSYWAQGNYIRRLAYVKGLIVLGPVQRFRGSNKKLRDFTAKYHLQHGAAKIQVCRKCFRLALGESESFIENVVTKIWETMDAQPDVDMRGRQPPKNKTPEAKIDEVKKHIDSFPAYESHYSRSHTSKKYLPIGLTVTKMYELYASSVEQPVKKEIYRRTFQETGLKFKQPHLDRCHRCDVYHAQLMYERDESEIVRIRELQQEHHEAADISFKEKAKDKKIAKESNGKMILGTFDLQQCLPTPSLHTNVSFYKRQLWTYNLTINNSTFSNTICYMWHEAEAKRGSNEIASCLNRFLGDLDPKVEEATFYSDSCGGQNKNKVVCAMFSIAVADHKTVQVVNHKFLEPGHTRMECDHDHAAIEKTQKSRPDGPQHPDDCY